MVIIHNIPSHQLSDLPELMALNVLYIRMMMMRGCVTTDKNRQECISRNLSKQTNMAVIGDFIQAFDSC